MYLSKAFCKIIGWILCSSSFSKNHQTEGAILHICTTALLTIFELWLNLNWIFSMILISCIFLWMCFLDHLLVNIVWKFEEHSNNSKVLVNCLLFMDFNSSQWSQHLASLIIPILKNAQCSTSAMTNQLWADPMTSLNSHVQLVNKEFLMSQKPALVPCPQMLTLMW